MDGAPSFEPEFREQLLDLFVWRRDVRRFRRDPLPEGALERLIGIAALSPSVGLSEPWRFVLVESPEVRAKIRANFEAANAEALSAQNEDRAGLYARLKLAGLDDAPVQFALFADRGTLQGHGLGRLTMPRTIDYSAVMALHTLWLAARAEGIGLGWVSILDPEAASRTLDAAPGWELIGYFCLGWPVADDWKPALERQAWEQRRAPASTIHRR
ncbi:MAG TPA: 5,6-dimethylbenzimidazole synthase [Devosiaceae bacterium]|jgi:5,6-dimethylbenzimidazole synthase|nr:5,6-dimethylbenzimidazole synthase [Devosiaceae bacterium]